MTNMAITKPTTTIPMTAATAQVEFFQGALLALTEFVVVVVVDDADVESVEEADEDMTMQIYHKQIRPVENKQSRGLG